MTKRIVGLGLALGTLVAAVATCKKDDPKEALRKFQSAFYSLHQNGIMEGFFQCLYGGPTLPAESEQFVERIKKRFQSNPAGFIQEKSEGCRKALEEATEKVRLLTAPTVELGSARDAYTDAATEMADAWIKVHRAFVDFKTVEDARIEFNSIYKPILEKAGDVGWARVQRFEKPGELQAFLDADPRNKEILLGAYRYLNFVQCILAAYHVDPRPLLIEDTKAEQEGRVYLLGVKALRDKLTSLCTGEHGSPTNILEWVQRVKKQCFPVLEVPEPTKPELFDQMMLWWSSDGARDPASGEAYSSLAVISHTCFGQTVDLDKPLKEFLPAYNEFQKAVSGIKRALAAAR